MTTDVRPIATQPCDGRFLMDRDDGGAFEAGGNLTQLQTSVEDLHEDWHQPVSAKFSGRKGTHCQVLERS